MTLDRFHAIFVHRQGLTSPSLLSLSVPPTICFTLPAWISMHGRKAQASVLATAVADRTAAPRVTSSAGARGLAPNRKGEGRTQSIHVPKPRGSPRVSTTKPKDVGSPSPFTSISVHTRAVGELCDTREECPRSDVGAGGCDSSGALQAAAGTIVLGGGRAAADP
eukprot:scaffold3827_cov394-Prasinococcus_capsulatus_cf.AAC.4